MEYLIIFIVLALSILAWKFPLKRTANKILEGNKYASFALSLVCFAIIPYAIALLALIVLGYNPNVLHDFKIILVLLFVPLLIIRKSVTL